MCLKTCPTGLEPAYAGLEVPCVSITLRAYKHFLKDSNLHKTHVRSVVLSPLS